MWVIFGSRTKAKPVPEGREESRHCKKCKTVTRYIECDITDKFHVFFIDLAGTTQRRLVCTVCGEDVAVASAAGIAGNVASTRRAVLSPSPPPADKIRDEQNADRKLAELKERMRKDGKLK